MEIYPKRSQCLVKKNQEQGCQPPAGCCLKKYVSEFMNQCTKAAEMLFTGNFMDAEEAKRLNLLNKLVPAENLESETMSLARQIANGPPIAIRLAKLQLYQGLEIDLDIALKLAAAFETITLSSEDHKEGVAAFREKRQPQYRGE